MSEHFEIGEMAVVRRPGSPRDGSVCTIVRPLKFRVSWYGGAMYAPPRVKELCYKIQIGAKIYNCPPQYLRKIRPPDHKVVQWDSTFNPTKQKA